MKHGFVQPHRRGVGSLVAHSDCLNGQRWCGRALSWCTRRFFAPIFFARIDGVKRPSSLLAVLSVLLLSFASLLPTHTLTAQDSPDAPQDSALAGCGGLHALEIVSQDVIPDTDAVEAETFEMAIRLHKTGPLPGLVLHVGLDYDELVLTNKAPTFRLDDAWDGQVTFTETGIPSVHENTVSFSVSFAGHSDWAFSEDAEIKTLGYLLLGVRPEFAAAAVQEANRAAHVRFNADGSGFDVPPDTSGAACLVDGTVNVLLRDEIKIGSGKMTNMAQIVDLPVTFTHLTDKHVYLEFGLDVESDSLEVIDVMLSDHWKRSFEDGYDARFDLDRAALEFDEAQGTVSLQFPGGLYPQLIRTHLLTVQVAFDPTGASSAAGEPDGGDPASVGDEMWVAPQELSETGDGGEGGLDLARELVPGMLEIVPHRFIRGDVDTDGHVALNDVISLLRGIVLGDPLPCLEATDSDNDAQLGIGDGIYLLTHLFVSGPAPSAPYPQRGADPEEESSLGCADYSVPFFKVSD